MFVGKPGGGLLDAYGKVGPPTIFGFPVFLGGPMMFRAKAAKAVPLLLAACSRITYCPLVPKGTVPVIEPVMGPPAGPVELKTRPGGSPSAASHNGLLLAPIPGMIIFTPLDWLVLVYCRT